MWRAMVVCGLAGILGACGGTAAEPSASGKDGGLEASGPATDDAIEIDDVVDTSTTEEVGCPGAGNPCTPEVCRVGKTVCDPGSIFPTCEPIGLAPIGSTCGSGNVCTAAGTCSACVTGTACTPTAPCRVGKLDCASGEAVCNPSGNAPSGTGCGAGKTCNAMGVCEVGCPPDTTSDPNNCGACGSVCPLRPNATSTCSASSCGFACLGGFGSCDDDPINGCEVNLEAAKNNCTCGVSCGGSTAPRTCASSGCPCTKPLANKTCANIALEKAATASAGGLAALSAVDGNRCTSWNASAKAPQWLAVDLGSDKTIASVRFVPSMTPQAGNVTILIETRRNGVSGYTTAVTTTRAMINGKEEYVALKTPVSARWVRFQITSSISNVAFWEVGAFSCVDG